MLSAKNQLHLHFYAVKHTPLPMFLLLVTANLLVEAYMNAEAGDIEQIPEILRYIYDTKTMPVEARGSAEKVIAWQNQQSETQAGDDSADARHGMRIVKNEPEKQDGATPGGDADAGA